MIERNFGGRRVQIVKNYQRLDELSKLIEPFSYRVLKEDCLDLPDKIYIRREIELTDEQLKQAQAKAESDLAKMVADDEVTFEL
jgi:SNF2 family DNA or RNA helicase